MIILIIYAIFFVRTTFRVNQIEECWPLSIIIGILWPFFYWGIFEDRAYWLKLKKDDREFYDQIIQHGSWF